MELLEAVLMKLETELVNEPNSYPFLRKLKEGGSAIWLNESVILNEEIINKLNNSFKYYQTVEEYFVCNKVLATESQEHELPTSIEDLVRICLSDFWQSYPDDQGFFNEKLVKEDVWLTASYIYYAVMSKLPKELTKFIKRYNIDDVLSLSVGYACGFKNYPTENQAEEILQIWRYETQVLREKLPYFYY